MRRRQLLLFIFSLLSLAIVSLMAFLAYEFPTLPFDLATTRELPSEKPVVAGSRSPVPAAT